jgi:N utilization substance protein B
MAWSKQKYLELVFQIFFSQSFTRRDRKVAEAEEKKLSEKTEGKIVDVEMPDEQALEGLEEEKKSLTILLMDQLKVTKKLVREAFLVVEKMEGRLEEIDNVIKEHSVEYRFERISQAELTVIRLGVFELLYEKALPDKVIFAEAIRLCRKFSTPQGANFVHAVLDSIYKKSKQLEEVCCK